MRTINNKKTKLILFDSFLFSSVPSFLQYEIFMNDKWSEVNKRNYATILVTVRLNISL